MEIKEVLHSSLLCWGYLTPWWQGRSGGPHDRRNSGEIPRFAHSLYLTSIQRREAFEEVPCISGTSSPNYMPSLLFQIGLPRNKLQVPLLCVLEPFLASNHLIVTPSVITFFETLISYRSSVVVLILDNTLRVSVHYFANHPSRQVLYYSSRFSTRPKSPPSSHTHSHPSCPPHRPSRPNPSSSRSHITPPATIPCRAQTASSYPHAHTASSRAARQAESSPCLG